MPELDGIGVVRMLKKHEMPLIAFVTAYDVPRGGTLSGTLAARSDPAELLGRRESDQRRIRYRCRCRNRQGLSLRLVAGDELLELRMEKVGAVLVLLHLRERPIGRPPVVG